MQSQQIACPFSPFCVFPSLCSLQKACCARATFFCTCCLQENFLSRKNPSHLTRLLGVIVLPSTTTPSFSSILLLLAQSSSVFSTLNLIALSLASKRIALAVFSSVAFASRIVFALAPKQMSSKQEKVKVLGLALHISLIQIRKRIGEISDPCRIPILILSRG